MRTLKADPNALSRFRWIIPQFKEENDEPSNWSTLCQTNRLLWKITHFQGPQIVTRGYSKVHLPPPVL